MIHELEPSHFTPHFLIDTFMTDAPSKVPHFSTDTNYMLGLNDYQISQLIS